MASLLAVAILATAPLAAYAANAGDPAPPVTLPHLVTGTTQELAALRGKVVYVDFWASWCPPCRRSMPELDALREEFDGRFEVFAINVDDDSEAGREFLHGMDIGYPVLADPRGEYAALFGIKGMPTGFLLDPDGVIRHVHEGYRPGDQDVLRERIQALLKETSE